MGSTPLKKKAVLAGALLLAGAVIWALLSPGGAPGNAVTAVGDAQAGEHLFKRICSGCHQVGESARASFGPPLNGIIGRRSGTSPGYHYSDAMASADLVWTRENLTAYLHAPKKVVPGTRMIFWGLSDPQGIADLLAYLQTFEAP